jgi:acyl-CoA hydrolase
MRYVNDPQVIRELDDFISINGCIAVDLFGQVSSESVGLRQISGTGGQVDFITGAMEAEHGRAFLAMHATFTDREGKKHSNILPHFSAGDIITTPRSQAPFIVTEYGIAALPGKTTWQRAEALIGIAHPDFREDLIKAAEEQKIWRQSSKR